jgi:hypothetical protein
MKHLLQWIATFLLLMFIAALMVEWAVGCGETYIDANGVTHHHECAFIPTPRR